MAAHIDVEVTQRRVLARLLSRGARTEWGRRHGYSKLSRYEVFAEAVPVCSYEKLRPWVMRMVGGESDVLWPGRVRRFAQSSGTSDGRSKYIPITDESLRVNHYRGGSDAVAHYLAHNPQSRLFEGRALILGGSFANGLTDLPKGTRVGDLSATLIDRIPAAAGLLRVPSKRIALMENWTEKLPLLARKAAQRKGITNLSGVPSWMLSVLKEVLAIMGKEDITQVWPRLEVFFHGGIAFDPYRAQYKEIIPSDRMHYLETYNASEGFFAVQDDPEVRAMSLLLDAGMFYEFEPLEGGAPVPAWQVEEGRVYALLLSGVNGLWRYGIGDTVRVRSLSPLRITIEGRTKHYINAFGEELMVHNAEQAVTAACVKHGCSVLNFTAAPLFETGATTNGCHQWVIEFAKQPADLPAFARTLDDELRRVNSDYDAKRTGDLFLTPLRVVVARQGLFDRWLASTGKLGGQRKVPRLCNDRRFIEPLLAANI